MKSLTGFSSLWMEGNLKEIVTFLAGNFAEKKEIGRKPYVPKVEALPEDNGTEEKKRAPPICKNA